MEQLTLLPNPMEPTALTRQTRKVERLQRELRNAVRQLEDLLRQPKATQQERENGAS